MSDEQKTDEQLEQEFNDGIARELRRMADEAEHGMYHGVVISAYGHHPEDVNKQHEPVPLFNFLMSGDAMSAIMLLGVLGLAQTELEKGFNRSRETMMAQLMAAPAANQKLD